MIITYYRLFLNIYIFVIICICAAEHVVREKDDIQQAMEFLQHCDLVRIEDILPFFSDFVTIDHFKEAICNSLQVRTKAVSEFIIRFQTKFCFVFKNT